MNCKNNSLLFLHESLDPKIIREIKDKAGICLLNILSNIANSENDKAINSIIKIVFSCLEQDKIYLATVIIFMITYKAICTVIISATILKRYH